MSNKKELFEKLIKASKREGKYAYDTLIIFVAYLELMRNPNIVYKKTDAVYCQLNDLTSFTLNNKASNSSINKDLYGEDISAFLYRNFTKVFEDQCSMPGGRIVKEISMYSDQYILDIINILLLVDKVFNNSNDYIQFLEMTESIFRKKDHTQYINKLMTLLMSDDKHENILDFNSGNGERTFLLDSKINNLYSSDDNIYNIIQQRLVAACLDKNIYSYEENSIYSSDQNVYDLYGHKLDDNVIFDRTMGEILHADNISINRRLSKNIGNYTIKKDNISLIVNMLMNRTKKQMVMTVPSWFLINKNDDCVQLKKQLINNGYLSSVIYLPKRYSSYSLSDKAIIVLDKMNTTSTVLFVDLSDELIKDDLNDVYEMITRRTKSSNTKPVVGSEIARNSYSLGKNLYFIKEDIKEEININGLIKERVDLIEKYKLQMMDLTDLIERRK